MGTISRAMALLESELPNNFYTFGKGQARLNEPLYGIMIYETADAYDVNDEPIAIAEDNCPLKCIQKVIQYIKN